MDVPDRLRCQWPAHMRLASCTLAVMIPAARSPGRPTVHHDVTGYDCSSALPEDDEPFLGQGSLLVAPAGAGKSHTMAEFARLWTSFTGRRVIGLTTSTNAARVLEHEGLAESYNIAGFLGKNVGTDELRLPVPLHRDDVLVLDEASQLSTADLAMIEQAARHAGEGSSPPETPPSSARSRPGECSACWPGRSPPRNCTRSADSTRRGSGRPASGSATATRPRSPPTTGTAGSGAPMRKPPTTAPPACGSRITCAARTCCCSLGRTPKPPNCPGGCRPGLSSSARSGRRRPLCRTGTRPAPVT